MTLQGSVILGLRLLIGQRQRRRRRAFATTRDRTLTADGWQRTERVSPKGGLERNKNNKTYEEEAASLRGSPPGYESRATE